MNPNERMKSFIADNIQSVGNLEVLLLLKTQPQKFWNADEVSAELRSNPSYARDQLDELLARSLLDKSKIEGVAHYKYSPPNPDVAAVIDYIAVSYSEKRLAIINLIFSQPIDKIKVFANAFKFKKE